MLDKFTASVNFCIRICLEHNLTSRASLHRAAYAEWKARFALATHWFHSAGQVATQTLRSWRNFCRAGRASLGKPPVYKARTMRLELWDENSSSGLCRFQGNAVQIRIRFREHLWLPLLIVKHHESAYLSGWREGAFKVGEITVSLSDGRANIYVPFKHEVESKHIQGVCGVDINERSVDLCILKPEKEPRFIKLDVSRLPAIRHSSQLKRKSIQKKFNALPQRANQMRFLQAKYCRREHNRTNQIIHLASKKIASIAQSEGVAVAFENIKGIRCSMVCSRHHGNGITLRRDIRRRLNQWPFRKLQSYVSYKVVKNGFPTVEVDNYNKSKDCPICSQYNRPNGHAYKCQRCGFEGDRHQVASWNIAKDGARHVPADCWQMKRVGKELAAPKKRLAEPERILVRSSTGI